MTREEAIYTLQGSQRISRKMEEAVDIAIKALKQEPRRETVTEFADRCRECGARYGKLLKQQPCEDAISRQAVDTLVDELARAISDEKCCISRGRSTATIMQDILELPSVTPQPIECEERKNGNCPFYAN